MKRKAIVINPFIYDGIEYEYGVELTVERLFYGSGDYVFNKENKLWICKVSDEFFNNHLKIKIQKIDRKLEFSFYKWLLNIKKITEEQFKELNDEDFKNLKIEFLKLCNS